MLFANAKFQKLFLLLLYQIHFGVFENRYLYCDDLNVHAACVWETVYAAQKYQIPKLLEVLEEQLINSLTIENVFKILLRNQLFELQRLNRQCFEMIDVQTQLVTQTQGYIIFISLFTLTIFREPNKLTKFDFVNQTRFFGFKSKHSSTGD